MHDPAAASTLVTRKPFTAAIFDFEGTLVGFEWQLARAEAELRKAFAALGCSGEAFERGNYATMWNAAIDHFKADPGRVAEIRRTVGPIYDRWDADALGRWTLRPGAAQTLQALAAAGLRVAIVSNIGRLALSAAVQRLAIAGSVASILSRDDVTRMKPHPEGIARTLAGWGIEATSALFVGDSRADVLAARAAGVAVAIVGGGEGSAADWAAAPPDRMVSRLDEVVALAGADAGAAGLRRSPRPP